LNLHTAIALDVTGVCPGIGCGNIQYSNSIRIEVKILGRIVQGGCPSLPDVGIARAGCHNSKCMARSGTLGGISRGHRYGCSGIHIQLNRVAVDGATARAGYSTVYIGVVVPRGNIVDDQDIACCPLNLDSGKRSVGQRHTVPVPLVGWTCAAGLNGERNRTTLANGSTHRGGGNNNRWVLDNSHTTYHIIGTRCSSAGCAYRINTLFPVIPIYWIARCPGLSPPIG